MTWFVWLGLAAVIAAVVAVIGIQPKGARPVGGTHLMGAGRLALLVIVITCLYLAFRARSGG